jgi:hypothetical protein
MTERICDQREQLLDLLYGDGEADHLVRLERHVADCAACAAEISALEGVRTSLRAWTPPEARPSVGILPNLPQARRRWLPAWGMAAAAVLVLSAGAGLANLEIRYGSEGLVARTGWSQPASEPSGPVAVGISKADVLALENRLRAELLATVERRAVPVPPPLVAAAPRDDAEVIRRVRALIEESERRQDRELALRLTQVVKDFDRQRQADLSRIQAGFGELQGMTGAEVARQREQLNYLMRVSSRPRQ